MLTLYLRLGKFKLLHHHHQQQKKHQQESIKTEFKRWLKTTWDRGLKCSGKLKANSTESCCENFGKINFCSLRSMLQTFFRRDSGGGSVGKAVTSDTRGPWFESRHRQRFYWITFNCIEKKIKKKRHRIAHFFKKNLACPKEKSILINGPYR